jgi:hypothetical protein
VAGMKATMNKSEAQKHHAPHLLKYLTVIAIFFTITQYNTDTHNAHALTPMNARTQTLPLWVYIFED